MVFLLILLLTANPNLGNDFLPQEMTAEESLRVDEIGKGHIVTSPPSGWVETPGELEPLYGVFVTWRYGWYDYIFYEIVREVVEVSRAYIIVRSGSEQTNVTNYLNSHGVPLDSVYFMTFSNNSIWIRDYGPWFMRQEDNTEGIVDFIYNRPRPLDDTIPWRIGNAWGIQVYGSPLEHAGGNFMVDGLGTGFASDLIYDENLGYSPAEIESLMLAYSGLEQFIVVQKMNIEYTGHIDLWTKILNDTLVLVGEYAPGHPNYNLLNQNADLIASLKNREDFPFRVARMPMPWSMSDAPPTYLNSLMVNNKVLVPTWGLAEDDTAIFIYQQLLPDHQIVGINCSAMSGSGGAIHCITMQAPSRLYIHIKHYPLPDSTNDTLNPYRVRAQIITSSSLTAESTLVYYKINSSPAFDVTPLAAVGDTPGVYAGYIPAQSPGDTVYYYLQAKNSDNIRRTSPVDVPPHIYSFLVAPGVSIAEKGVQESGFTLTTYPNPAHRNLTFSLNLSEATNVRIEIYNVLGQRIKLLENVAYKPGEHTVVWNLLDDKNCPLKQGVYFYSIGIDEGAKKGKVLLIR
ncbi:MAG: T9SS type A sorting domain-containing protein [Candidatus Cloacimonadota bacterium]|nr:MAG: T9SS type A sorting domain-containing protein [Candidatus Cloacimonadota bacterium]